MWTMNPISFRVGSFDLVNLNPYSQLGFWGYCSKGVTKVQNDRHQTNWITAV